MKSQPTFKSSRFGQLLSTIFLLILLSLFAAGNVQAKKPVPDPGPPLLDNEASWSGDLVISDVMESSARTCSLTQMAADESSGTFSCGWNDVDVMYDFSYMSSEPAHRRGDDWRCEHSMLYSLVPDLQYSYSWNGDCTSGCEVTIVNAFSNCGVFGGSVGRMTIEGFATATSSQPNLNPFTEAQSLSIDYFHVTLFGVKGNNKVLAVCKLTPTTPVTFVTSPVELDP